MPLHKRELSLSRSASFKDFKEIILQNKAFLRSLSIHETGTKRISFVFILFFIQSVRLFMADLYSKKKPNFICLANGTK